MPKQESKSFDDGVGPITLHTVVLGRERRRKVGEFQGEPIIRQQRSILGVGITADGIEEVRPLSILPSKEILRVTIDGFLQIRPDLTDEVIAASRRWKRMINRLGNR